MTTKVSVEANHGWPVKVTGVKVGTLEPVNYGGIVPKDQKQDFYVHSGMDIIVHEIPPDEQQTDPEPEPAAEPA
ncbi:MAG: hypothetical protein JWM58_566 [Rhizobium sp.]|nr:hypothetical protein [Rhizobium sp.]